METNKVISHLRAIKRSFYTHPLTINSVIDYTKRGVPFIKIIHNGQQYRICYFKLRKYYRVFENGVKLITIKDRNDLLSFCRFMFAPSLPPENNLYRKITKQDFENKYVHR